MGEQFEVRGDNGMSQNFVFFSLPSIYEKELRQEQQFFTAVRGRQKSEKRESEKMP